jgi:hypothetical protein
MIKFRRAKGKRCVLTVIAVASAALSIGAATALADPLNPLGPVTLLSDPNETFAQAVVDEVKANPTSLPAWVGVLSGMLENLQAGQVVEGLGASSPDAAQGQVQAALDCLSGLDANACEVNPDSLITLPDVGLPPLPTITLPGLLAAIKSSTLAPAVAPRASSAMNPAKFPTHGHAINNRRSWTTYYADEFKNCSITGCDVLDRVSANLLVDPGAKTTKFSTHMTYFPKTTGIFGEVHFEVWALCHRSLQQCGNENSPSLEDQKNHTWNLSSSTPMNGDYLTHAAVFWAEIIPGSGVYSASKAKTGTAKCNKRDNRCRY